MAAMEERMLKLRHRGPRVTAKDRVVDLQRQAREDSQPTANTPSPASSPDQPLKRRRVERSEQGNPGTSVSAGEAFVLPPCFAQRQLFEGKPPVVQVAKRELILGLDPKVRGEGLHADVSAVIRMLETSLTLNDEVANSRAEAAKDKDLIAAQELENMDYWNELQKLRGLDTRCTTLAAELREAREKHEPLVEEKDRL